MRLNHAVGGAAEEAACRYLTARGCRIVERNWHCRYGEIDIVAEDGDVVVFVEVRRRSSGAYGGAAASITPAKLGKLRRSAECWLQGRPSVADCRIDALLTENGRDWVWLKNIGHE